MFGLTRGGVVEIHIVALLDVAQLPAEINDICLSAAATALSPKNVASNTCVPIKDGLNV